MIHSNNVNCHELAKIFNFFTAKKQCALDNKVDFS